MSTHNLCFYGETMKIIIKLSSNTQHICSAALEWALAADLSAGCCTECPLLNVKGTNLRQCLCPGQR